MRKSEVDIVSPANADSDFIIDVIKGLFSSPKFLKSKYFYDKRGDELFRKIMELPEYYLTRYELEILNNHKASILSLIDAGDFQIS